MFVSHYTLKESELEKHILNQLCLCSAMIFLSTISLGLLGNK